MWAGRVPRSVAGRSASDYEIVIAPRSANVPAAGFVTGDWIVRFEARSLHDIHALGRNSPEHDRASLRARKTDQGLAFDALSGSVQARAQREIFRKHIGQDRGKKHRNADPEPRRVMDVPPVAP
jgi:hypothetical protein